MQVAIVYESLFGNTEELAEAVCVGLRAEGARVDVRSVGEQEGHDLRPYDLLVLAAPTHALTLSSPSSRAQAVTRGAPVSAAVMGMREWLAGQGQVLDGTPALTAVFDTRVRGARHWPGSAARRTARVLRRRGVPVLLVTSFYVGGVEGPLSPGELERARAWGRAVARAARSASVAHSPGA